MNKFLVSLALVSSLSISSLIAESSTLNKTDSELLFGTAQNVNVAVLSENEMKETKGESLTTTIVGGIVGGVAAAIGEDIWDEIKSWF